jgi:(E)-4-hydroxy-3-methylbut-2-enyl-diphosphate synthase
MGMVESAMEFLRIARNESYHNIILSMKASNPQVMVQAYRLLVNVMMDEFGECYPLHLGVTEAGDGEDGRIKSAIGIGTLLEDGLGDTIRVSLTEDPEFEIPVCRDLVKRYTTRESAKKEAIPAISKVPFSPFEYTRRNTNTVSNIGGKQVPVVVADFMKAATIRHEDLQAIGYTYNTETDKFTIADAAADYIYTAKKLLDFALPGTLKVICDHSTWLNAPDKEKYYPLFQSTEYLKSTDRSGVLNFVATDVNEPAAQELLQAIRKDRTIVLCLYSSNAHAMPSVRRYIIELVNQGISCPVILVVESNDTTIDEQLIHFSTDSGALLLDGMGDGVWLMNEPEKIQNHKVSGRTYLETKNNHQFINNTSFSILQATRTRISKTEYISCPSCGRTLFDLQETTAKIRSVTHHLKGVKIAIMGCIVNGPGEMADADFGYVGSGPGKITLYKGKEIVKRNVDSAIAVEELINLLKENNAWVEKTA